MTRSTIKATLRTVAIAVVIVAALVLAVLYVEHSSADTERCSSYSEFTQIDDGMSVGTVQRIFDVDGRYVDPDGGRFQYRFRSCSGETRFVISFSELTGVVVNKWTTDID